MSDYYIPEELAEYAVGMLEIGIHEQSAVVDLFKELMGTIGASLDLLAYIDERTPEENEHLLKLNSDVVIRLSEMQGWISDMSSNEIKIEKKIHEKARLIMDDIGKEDWFHAARNLQKEMAVMEESEYEIERVLKKLHYFYTRLMHAMKELPKIIEADHIQDKEKYKRQEYYYFHHIYEKFLHTEKTFRMILSKEHAIIDKEKKLIKMK